ncbi:murein biosynthesis integral membrane protein MurJ [Puniceicoccus vermicola]|uniref:Probable lipid II flippase MurJ n=1 Tax=Puniceicoccus vermicola TaxID=388746 RepID=A0A7X1AW00_9BACT|nr:murein biosynthesis integral membrane protein MurJ [Puniceicoccus vermicola]MBC2600976.1 murein biosynthesis integral membrane protein MurJ [Puniceicoccus vermicola]
MRKNLKSILTVSSSTLGSRILGLFRDVFVYAQLGLSPTNSAFILAFTLPNLFRRLFGEGALSSALIPIYTEENLKNDNEAGFRLLNRTLTRLFLVLFSITLLFGALVAIPLLSGKLDETRYGEASRLGLLLFPYVIPICLAALLAGALQVLGRFFTAAITPVFLNVCMIAALAGPALWLGETPFQKALWLSGGVLVGGLVQLLLPAIDLYRRGWRPAIDLSSDESLRKLQLLFFPALAGAAILQVNILVSRTLAFFLNDDAVALLYLAARLVELPLGIFGIAAATVLFPEFSRFAAGGDTPGLRRSYRNGSALVASITLPAFVGLALLGDTIFRAVFAWGLFDPRDAALAAPVLAIFATGLPFYAQSTLLSRAHQARQDMKTPVRVAGWVLLANLIFSIGLMIPFGVYGLAASNTLASIVQVCLLQHRLRKNVDDGESWMPVELWKVGIASLLLLGYLLLLPASSPDASKTILLLRLLWIIPTSIALYFGVLFALRFGPVRDFLPAILRRKKARSPR